MIGNTEYSLVSPEPGKNCCHNLEVMSATEGPPYIPLPFDFDFSGLVNAGYAQPNPRYPIGDVRTRFYKGVCRNNDVLPKTLDLFRQRRDVFRRIIGESDFLSGRSRRSIDRYVDAFYRIIEDPESVQTEFIAGCNEMENAYGVDPGFDAQKEGATEAAPEDYR
jgi:hypothetical protein